jgi:hypothetical protein
MIATQVIDEIFTRLNAYKLVRHTGFAELLPDRDGKVIPAIYCNNGDYKHVVDDYDWSEGIAYIRYNGRERAEVTDENNFIGCQDLLRIVYPLTLVIIGKRKGKRPYEVASLVQSKISGMYEALATTVGAVSIDVTSITANYSIKENLDTEFEGAKVVWDTALYMIALDLEVEVIGDASCLNTEEPCDYNTLAVDGQVDFSYDGDNVLTY